ncbi:response regulator [Duganella callida]|uniref:histidine kinase n=1 Tax=Duganella callida TaxID=2561932 RepID=A0A4Y9S721_9BURK|nr:response regulator [Duganella callida]TFW17272.1 response regulator [Duganella callida]
MILESNLAVFSRAALEEQLRHGSAQRQALFEAIDDGFCIIEFIDGPHGPLSDYVHVEANTGYERHTGIGGIIGKRLREIEPDNAQVWLDLYGKVLLTGEPARFEQEFVAAGRYIEVSARRVGPAAMRQVSVLFRDITARKKTEAELRDYVQRVQFLTETLEQRVEERTAELVEAQAALRQAHKMEAVGQLTGGLAHDFNNILAGISVSLELMHVRLSQGRLADLDRHVSGAQAAVRRAAALTQRLLAFSRRQTLDPKPARLDRVVAGMEELICRSVGPAIAVEPQACSGLWHTFVDIGQLENALLNLCLNARDAMPDGGRLRIATANQTLDERAAAALAVAAGEYVSLAVSDTGVGMPAEVMARAFDPFFTTKPAGQGTGLGLSMVYGFAGQSGGAARIDSAPGRGTTVSLYLPRHAAVDDSPEQAAAPAVEVPAAVSRKKILVVDDEALVRMMTAEVLEELGYEVIDAADGAAALRQVAAHADIDLLLTDVGLPAGMNGRQLADAVRALRPELPVLFVTGYAENAVLNHGHLARGMQVLTKPFDANVLARRVREMAGGDGPSAL